MPPVFIARPRLGASFVVRLDLTRRRIAESLTVEQIPHLDFLLLAERPPGLCTLAGVGFRLLLTVVPGVLSGYV